MSYTDDGANIQIVGEGSLDISNNGIISVGSEEGGNGGTIDIDLNSLNLKEGGTIFAITTSRVGENISLAVEDTITLDRDSLISAQAFNRASGEK